MPSNRCPKCSALLRDSHINDGCCWKCKYRFGVNAGNYDTSNVVDKVIVQCPKCKNQYKIPDLTKCREEKILATCPSCGWNREFADPSFIPLGYYLWWWVIGSIFLLIGMLDLELFSILPEDFSFILILLGPVLCGLTILGWVGKKWELRDHKLMGANYDEDEYGHSPPQYSDKLEVEEEIESVGYGSGVLISQEGIIITNNHVVDGANSIEIKFPDLITIYSARVVAKDPHTDIAVLKINSYGKSVQNGKSIPLTKNSKKIQSGLEVHTIGYPLGNIMGENPRTSSGRISSPFGIGDDQRYFQIGNPIQAGNSGGVVFDNSGNIMGIIVASISEEKVYETTGSMAQNINFAIKFSYIQALLDNTNYEIDYSSLSNEDIELEDLIEKIEPFTCQITSKS